MTADLVIFDCDGVLVDSETLSNRALGEAITEAGWPLSYEETRARFIGLTIAGVKTQVEQKLGRALPADWVADFDRHRNNLFEREGVPPMPGVEAVLEALVAAERPYCLASSGKPEKMAVTLRLSGLQRFFSTDQIFSVTMVERPKPHPDLFLLAAKSFGVEPERALVIEDSTVGVRAAVAAGIPVLGYALESDPDALSEAGAKVFRDMADLMGLLGL